MDGPETEGSAIACGKGKTAAFDGPELEEAEGPGIGCFEGIGAAFGPELEDVEGPVIDCAKGTGAAFGPELEEAKKPVIGWIKGNGAGFDGSELEEFPVPNTVVVADFVCVREEPPRNWLLERTAEAEGFAVWGTARQEISPYGVYAVCAPEMGTGLA